jgi:hypothetical protein
MRAGALGAILCLIILAPDAYAQPQCLVAETLWQSPRTGETILTRGGIAECVKALFDRDDADLLIHHGSDDESILHAAELRYWLIALGLEPARVKLHENESAGPSLMAEVIEAK